MDFFDDIFNFMNMFIVLIFVISIIVFIIIIFVIYKLLHTNVMSSVTDKFTVDHKTESDKSAKNVYRANHSEEKDTKKEVKRCRNCDAKISADTEFCPFCGVRLE